MIIIIPGRMPSRGAVGEDTASLNLTHLPTLARGQQPGLDFAETVNPERFRV